MKTSSKDLQTFCAIYRNGVDGGTPAIIWYRQENKRSYDTVLRDIKSFVSWAASRRGLKINEEDIETLTTNFINSIKK